MKTFKNIFDFQQAFSNEEKCRTYLEQQRWNDTPACPFCGSINVHRFPNGKILSVEKKSVGASLVLQLELSMRILKYH